MGKDKDRGRREADDMLARTQADMDQDESHAREVAKAMMKRGEAKAFFDHLQMLRRVHGEADAAAKGGVGVTVSIEACPMIIALMASFATCGFVRACYAECERLRDEKQGE